MTTFTAQACAGKCELHITTDNVEFYEKLICETGTFIDEEESRMTDEDLNAMYQLELLREGAEAQGYPIDEKVFACAIKAIEDRAVLREKHDDINSRYGDLYNKFVKGEGNVP